MGRFEYLCRAYRVESSSGFGGKPMVALHLELASTTSDAIGEISAKYNLTDREQEALRGISMGLTSLEVAKRMNISPNTVKAFLRLIMIKMGVTARGGIVANILHRASMEETEPYAQDLARTPLKDEKQESQAAEKTRRMLRSVRGLVS
ncbi:MAG: helix-turn-helix transcriptional regulator [Bryobacteraceae bacterium]|jgi:DNA-binding CsgD family transcriptional regulator